MAFEEQLADLIAKRRKAGDSWDVIISGLEIQMMAAREQEADDEHD